MTLDIAPSKETYLSKSIFNLEFENLFQKSWFFAGVTSDLPEAGSYKTLHYAGYSYLLIKDRNGNLRAFHNLCRHRGVELLEGDGKLEKHITCPYHRWTYSEEGRLIAVPSQKTCFADLDKNSWNLKNAGLGILNSLIFLHPDPDACFENWIAPVKDFLWPHDPTSSELKEQPELIYEMQCNWKIFAENALDGYHLSHLHAETLGGPRPEENEWIRCQDHLIWYARDGDGDRHSLPLPVRDSLERRRASKIAHVKKHVFGGVYFLFPATLIVPTPYNFSVSQLLPSDEGSTDLLVRNWSLNSWFGGEDYSLKDIDGYDPETGKIRSVKWSRPALKSNDFQTEDVWIAEKRHKGLRSPAYETGPFADGSGGEEAVLWLYSALRRQIDYPDQR
ncbi:MAG: aromatic ring-hydroxylating dioxygenase subunit alpha [Sneathiellales bacterium]|nr:aromatic ring-hydroxylating dioxygenase subunit alpha [Sneathiellales bacterium]